MRTVEVEETAGVQAPVEEVLPPAGESRVKMAIELANLVLKELAVIYKHGNLTKAHKRRLDVAGTITLRLRDLLKIEAAGVPVEPGEVASVRRCRVCGCTDEEGCLEGCYWVAEDLCSSCEGQEGAEL
jgi:hypothetical protein